MSRHKTLIGVGWVCAALAFFPGYETRSVSRNGAAVEITRWRVGLSPLVEVETQHAVGPAEAAGQMDSLERTVRVNLLSLSAALAVAGISLLAWGVLTRGGDAPASSSSASLRE